jgi:hypothetical protein
MNMSEMVHRVTDAIRRMTNRLTHRRDTQRQYPFSKENASDAGMRNDRDDVT